MPTAVSAFKFYQHRHESNRLMLHNMLVNNNLQSSFHGVETVVSEQGKVWCARP
jgi:hypothetical protein